MFAAVGTVGAVVVALRQISRQERRSLHVDCRQAIASPANGITVNLVTLRGTNDGFRPVKITQAYIQTDDGRMIVAPLSGYGDSLPKLLLDGESVEVAWEWETLNKARTEQGFSRYLYAFFTDTVGRVYVAPYPGIEKRRVGPPWRRRTVWEPRRRAVLESPAGRGDS